MKHVRALSAEPPLLAQYRADYPSEVARPATQASATWEGFKAEVAAYQELLGQLVERQQGLCIYCEQRLVDANGTLVPLDYQVEHVQAKSQGAGRVLAWGNLALACGGGTYRHHADTSRKYAGSDNTSCGQTKDDRDLPTGCDPRGYPVVAALIQVSNAGELTVNEKHCLTAGRQPDRVADAVTLLNLKCERLRKARQDSRDNVNTWFVDLLAKLDQATHLDASQRAQLLDEFVAIRLQPDASGFLCPWWSSERSALEAAAEPWLARHVHLFQ